MAKDEKTGEDASGGDKFREALSQAQKQVPSPERSHSDAMLAAHRLAQPFAQLRANQLRMESLRAEVKDGARAAAFAARADAADRQVASIEGGIARLRIVQPDSCANSVTVYGYIRDGADPLAGASVALFDGDEILAQIDSDKDGSFKLSVCSEVPLGVQVSTGGKLAHRDSAEVHPPSAVAAYRIIDIGGGETPAPVQDPPKGDCAPSQPAEPAEVEAQATGVAPVEQPAVPGAPPPPAAAATPAPAETGAQFDDLVPLLTGSEVASDLEWSEDKVTRKWLAARGIKDLETAKEAAALPVEEVAKRFKIDADLAKRLKRALTAALKKLGSA
jgi:hypothetical protein